MGDETDLEQSSDGTTDIALATAGVDDAVTPDDPAGTVSPPAPTPVPQSLLSRVESGIKTGAGDIYSGTKTVLGDTVSGAESLISGTENAVLKPVTGATGALAWQIGLIVVAVGVGLWLAFGSGLKGDVTAVV